MGIYQPYAIGPNILFCLQMVERADFKMFLCSCTAMIKDEHSFRCHMIYGYHLEVQEKITQFSSCYDGLPEMDFDLLGDTSRRREDLLDSIQN